MIKTFLKKNWLILLILGIAAFFRLYRIGDYMEFLGDQGRDVVIVWNFLKNGHLFFIGPPTSIGNMYLGPYYYYLIVVPGLLLTWFNPVGPSIIVAVLGVLTVYLLFRFSKVWFNPKVAYIAAFLYAISPVVIKYSSFSWNPNIMPLFALIFVFFITKSQYILASIAFIICLNSHYLALLLLPLAGIIWIYQYRLINTNHQLYIKNTIIAVGIFFISLTPQVLFDIKHHGQNTKALLTFFSQQTSINNSTSTTLLNVIPIFQQIITRLLAGKNVFFGIIISLIFVSLFTWTLYKQFKNKKFNKPFLIMSAWFVVGIFGLFIVKQNLLDHYFAFLFPVVFILFSYLIFQLPKYLTIATIILVTTLSILENPFRWTPPRQLDTTIQIDNSIIAASNNQPFNFALLAKTNYDPGYRYFFTKDNSPVKLLSDKKTDQLFVVCEPSTDGCVPINNPFWDIAAYGWAKIDTQWEISGIKIFRLVHNVY